MLRLLPLLLLLACARPDHIEIDPRAPRLSRKGASMRLHAKLMDRAGKVFPMEAADWKSRDPCIAGISPAGEVTALSSGHTVLTASWNELTAELPLGLDGHPLRDREVHLISANPSVARVDPEGRVWPVAPGDVMVRANIDDKEGEVAVHVRAR